MIKEMQHSFMRFLICATVQDCWFTVIIHHMDHLQDSCFYERPVLQWNSYKMVQMGLAEFEIKQHTISNLCMFEYYQFLKVKVRHVLEIFSINTDEILLIQICYIQCNVI